MRLTKQSNYAVRTLMYCAVNDVRLSRVPDIANVHRISEAFLFKLIKPLVDNGLLHTVRGRNGGVKLGLPADEITLMQVVKITEDNFSMADCFGDGDCQCPLVGMCEYSLALGVALDAFFDALDGYTIADLVSQRVEHMRRLSIPS